MTQLATGILKALLVALMAKKADKYRPKPMTVEARCGKCKISFDITLPTQELGMAFLHQFATAHNHQENADD